MARVYTPAEKTAFAADFLGGKPREFLAAKYRMSHDAITKLRSRLGLAPRAPHDGRKPTFPPTPENIARVRELVNAGLSDSLIARKLQVDPGVIAGMRRRHGIAKPPMQTRKTKTPSKPVAASAPFVRREHHPPVYRPVQRAPVVSPRPVSAPVHGVECSWPMWGNERPTHRYCGNPAQGRWCSGHSEIGYTRAPAGRLAAVAL